MGFRQVTQRSEKGTTAPVHELTASPATASLEERARAAGVPAGHLAQLAAIERDQDGQPLTAAELAEHLGVNATWARTLLRRLCSAGLAEPADALPSTRGRPTPQFRLSLAEDRPGTDVATLPAFDAELVDDTTPPPGTDDDRLQMLVRGWLETTYTNQGTRDAYGDALGLDRLSPHAGGSRPPRGKPGSYRHLAWLRWCRAKSQDPMQVVTADITRWQIELDRSGMAVATRANWLNAATSFYGWLVDHQLLAANPAALTRDQRTKLGLSNAGRAGKKAIVLTPAQVHDLLAAAGRSRRGRSPLDALRARALVGLLTLGMRVSELTGLTRDSLHTTRGRRALRYTVKGGKTHTTYLSALAADALDDYLAARDHAERADLPALPGQVRSGRAPLLATRRGGFLDRADVWALLRRLAAAEPDLSELAETLHPHALRHFYITTGIEAGADINAVRDDVGHSTSVVTERSYNHATRDPSRSAVDLVATAITNAGAPAREQLDRFTAALARLSHPDPLEQLDAAHTLARYATAHPAFAAELRTVVTGHLATTENLHPRVHQALRTLQMSASG